MSCAWKEPNCRIGLILGTGTNACYLEEISAIGTVDPKDFPGQGPYSIGFFDRPNLFELWHLITRQKTWHPILEARLGAQFCAVKKILLN